MLVARPPRRSGSARAGPGGPVAELGRAARWPVALDPPPDLAGVRRILDVVRTVGRTSLLEHEGYSLLRCLGIAVPPFAFVRDAAEAAALEPAALDRALPPGGSVVVKVADPRIAHKTEVGGVAVVPNRPRDVSDAIARMAPGLGGSVAGYTIAGFVEHEAGLGGELLASLRWTGDFGPVVTVGPGGTEAEVVARRLHPDSRVAIVSPTLTPRGELTRALAGSIAVELATASLRGRAPRLPIDCVVDVVERLAALADLCGPDGLVELEVNPFAVTREGLVALDVLARLGTARAERRPDRPIERLARLLRPDSIAIVGVSATTNPGRIILRNLLRDGFPADHVWVVKPGADQIDGYRCVPDIASLPRQVDLLVVAVSAAAAPGVVTEAIERDAAAGLIVIPGGLEEKEGTGALVGRMREALVAARARGGGPLINGGNCLGIRSHPGRYDTMFIPRVKLPAAGGAAAPVAIIAQSGAFAIARLSRLRGIDPLYVVSVGNQMDLTVGDYLAYLADDADVEVFGAYVEGFAPMDGARFVQAARRITGSGRSVILHRAGRTGPGAAASASHTASIAGDAAVAHALAGHTGIVVADTVAEFDELLAAFARLRGRTPGGPRLAAVTNAGFECVAIADSLGPFELARLNDTTEARIRSALARKGIDRVVDVHNPLDLTPMADASAYEEVVAALLADDGVDLVLVGVVPFTVELATLERAAGHDEDLAAPNGIAARLVRLWASSSKPWAVVVDAGPLFDPLCTMLEDGGVPVYRTADAATRTLGRWYEARRGGVGTSP